MNIKIIFYKSSSKYYSEVCDLCSVFPQYFQENSTNTLLIDIHEMRENKAYLKSILDSISRWTKTEYYINESPVDIVSVLHILSIIDCENDCENCLQPEKQPCYSESGWGCKYIESISLRKSSFYSYSPKVLWYDIGHFSGNDWTIDKSKIFRTIQQESVRKSLNVCRFFSVDKLKESLDTLPDKISITDSDDCEWEYKYREAPLGLSKTEKIGVQPRQKKTFVPIEKNNLEPISSQKSKPNIFNSVHTVTFEDIGGVDDVIQKVREVIELPLIAPQVFEHYNLKPHRGILLYGPPGCGKTLIAKAVANESNSQFISISGPEILNRYIGQSEENLRKAFLEAKKYPSAILYFDEFDAIASRRNSDGNPLMTTVVNQLLTLMDGMDSSENVCIIASTNRLDIIDEAIRRPGRFDYVIEIKKPSLDGCKSIFDIHTRGMPIDPSFDKNNFVTNYLFGLSGAEIAFVASEAAYNSIRRTIDISKLLDIGYDFSMNDSNIIIEEDFIKAVFSLPVNDNLEITAE